MRKTLRVIITLFLVSTVVFPLLKVDLNLEEIFGSETNTENTRYQALVHTQSLLEKKLYDEMRNILINCEVQEYEIYITTTVDEAENTVFLEEIKIEVGKAFGEKIDIIKSSVPKEYQEVLKVGVKNE
jgi:L-rhamnose mutarotase